MDAKKIAIQKTGNKNIDAALEALKKAVEEEKQPITASSEGGETPHHFFGLASSCCN